MRRRRAGIRRQFAAIGVPKSRPRLRDLFGEASEGVGRRPGRTILTAIGIVVGVGAVVATLGLATTTAAQVSGQFDAVRATDVLVQFPNFDQGQADFYQSPIPTDAAARLGRLNGVRAAGELWVYTTGADVRSLPPRDLDSPGATLDALVSASPSVFSALGATVEKGRLYDAATADRAALVCVLSDDAAAAVGIDRLDGQTAIFIGDTPVVVFGIIHLPTDSSVAGGIFLPPRSLAAFGPPGAGAVPTIFVRVRLGAASQIGREAPYALAPQDPGSVQVSLPPDPGKLRSSVEGALNTFSLLLAAVVLGVGIIGIGNTMLVSVLERTKEIGLRRALGARPRHIAAQVLMETGMVGAFGSLLGGAGGGAVVVAVAAARGWTAVLDVRLLLLAPLLGTASGLLAGIQPAWRTTRIQPVEALRL